MWKSGLGERGPHFGTLATFYVVNVCHGLAKHAKCPGVRQSSGALECNTQVLRVFEKVFYHGWTRMDTDKTRRSLSSIRVHRCPSVVENSFFGCGSAGLGSTM